MNIHKANDCSAIGDLPLLVWGCLWATTGRLQTQNDLSMKVLYGHFFGFWVNIPCVVWIVRPFPDYWVHACGLKVVTSLLGTKYVCLEVWLSFCLFVWSTWKLFSPAKSVYEYSSFWMSAVWYGIQTWVAHTISQNGSYLSYKSTWSRDGLVKMKTLNRKTLLQNDDKKERQEDYAKSSAYTASVGQSCLSFSLLFCSGTVFLHISIPALYSHFLRWT